MQEVGSINAVFFVKKTPSSLMLGGEWVFVWSYFFCVIINLDRHIGQMAH